jgi:hypothetical protein
MSIENPNSTDATMGMNLRARVETRVAELTAALNGPTHEGDRAGIQLALSEIAPLMTGDLDNIPQVVAFEMNTWLEANKHLAEYHTKAANRRAHATHAKHKTHGSGASGRQAVRHSKSGKA